MARKINYTTEKLLFCCIFACARHPPIRHAYHSTSAADSSCPIVLHRWNYEKRPLLRPPAPHDRRLCAICKKPPVDGFILHKVLESWGPGFLDEVFEVTDTKLNVGACICCQHFEPASEHEGGAPAFTGLPPATEESVRNEGVSVAHGCAQKTCRQPRRRLDPLPCCRKRAKKRKKMENGAF